MSNPFYSAHCVVRDLSEGYEPRREVYLLGPQFCGGEKKVVAHVYSEVVADLIDAQPDLSTVPEPVRAFLRWCEENVVVPKKV